MRNRLALYSIIIGLSLQRLADRTCRICLLVAPFRASMSARWLQVEPHSTNEENRSMIEHDGDHGMSREQIEE